MPLAILLALAIFIVGFTLLNFLLPEVTTFRADIGCGTVATLSDGGKVLCLIGDGIIPYVVVAIISLAFGVITSRMRL